MDPDSPPEHSSSGGDANPSATGADTAAAEAALKARLSRKRTKTGCLTCRKRRIKCGEERPLCKNCVKSKRHCEGYSQRVVFKHPTFDYRPVAHGAGAHITFQAGPLPGSATHYVDHNPHALDPFQHPGLQPRPPSSTMPGFDGQSQHYAAQQQPPPYQYPPPPGYPTIPVHADTQPPQFPLAVSISPTHGYPGVAMAAQPIAHQNVHSFAPPTSGPVGYAMQPVAHTNGVPMPHPSIVHLSQAHSARPIASPQVAHPQSTVIEQSPRYAVAPDQPGPAVVSPTWSHHPHDQTSPSIAASTQAFRHAATPVSTTQQQWSAMPYTPTTEAPPRMVNPQSSPLNPYHAGSMPSTSSSPGGPPLNHITPEYYDQEYHPPTDNMTTAYLLRTAAVETQDDDYYDVVSDDDMDVEGDPVNGDQQPRNERTLGQMLAHNQIAIRDLQMRRYDTFIYEGILESYNVEQVANPLRNPATARVFAHFISATGPSLSIFERHPLNTSVLFSEGSVPLSQRGLWTYSMPMAALRNQGLLHAMLALASLHIARLQGVSETPSIQHYAWALKRIHHSVGDAKKRLKLTTIAASMLLGFYEIMTADHMKWNMHLTGSKQLFVEVDFVKLTQKFRRMKAEHVWRDQASRGRNFGEANTSQDDLLDQIYDVDERMVSHLIGREVRYDGHGSVETPQTPIPPDLDLSRFEMLKDLYWWYCKQDAYQSIVSGNPLLMDFHRWANCPPRAPLGRVDAVYGSFDHLILLLGRIADFSARDRKRKLKQVEVNGGQWRPAPGMNIPQPPTPVSAGRDGFIPNPHVSPTTPTSQLPQFYGMAPPPRANVQMPSSYQTGASIPTPQSANRPDPFDSDLQTATKNALDEYSRIRAALQTFKMSLGDAFEPLTSEYHAPMDTPFGPALFYRAYDIGCLWAVWNMAVIIAIRSHPHMPPAMHAAAGVAAAETAPFANEIGRIAAGIVPSPPEQPLNPSLGSALNESCMPSFFAAVQYHDAAQRHTTVMRIFSIARRTGWGSAELIANGCETAWVKAAAAGRGPPYTRVVRPSHHSDDPRLNGSWERLDPNADPDERDDGDRRLVKVKAPARLNWAIGVMGVEDDVERMKIAE